VGHALEQEGGGGSRAAGNGAPPVGAVVGRVMRREQGRWTGCGPGAWADYWAAALGRPKGTVAFMIYSK
jgi:hypothetical protein